MNLENGRKSTSGPAESGVLSVFLAASVVGLGQESVDDVDEMVVEVEEEEPAEESEWDVELDFVLNALPASLLINMDSDNFKVTDPGPGGNETSLSTVYMMPNISAGVGVELEDLYVDLTVGAGVLVNENFRSFLLQAGVSVMYLAAESFYIGPRAGVIYFTDPTWLDDEDDLDLDSDLGYVLGLQMSMGDKVSYIVSIDLISASFDIEAGTGVVPEDDKLDLTGLAIQFGVRGLF